MQKSMGGANSASIVIRSGRASRLQAWRGRAIGPLQAWRWRATGTVARLRASPTDWRKRMSNTLAHTLLVCTMLLVLVTMKAIGGDTASFLPLIALIAQVAGIIPLFRRFERRWVDLDDAAAADPALRGAYQRDRLALWLLAIGLPFALAALFRGAGLLLGKG